MTFIGTSHKSVNHCQLRRWGLPFVHHDVMARSARGELVTPKDAMTCSQATSPLQPSRSPVRGPGACISAAAMATTHVHPGGPPRTAPSPLTAFSASTPLIPGLPRHSPSYLPTGNCLLNAEPGPLPAYHVSRIAGLVSMPMQAPVHHRPQPRLPFNLFATGVQLPGPVSFPLARDQLDRGAAVGARLPGKLLR